MAVRGITKIRNESHIIGDTLDNWAPYCDAGIHVYCDAPTDMTADICRQHAAVVEVIESDLLDENRERAEWYCRQTVLHSARRFLTDDDWIVYFDGDEHLFDFDLGVLQPGVDEVACKSFDSYITPEDAALSAFQYHARRWVCPAWEFSPYFYSCRNPLDFWMDDQRNIQTPPNGKRIVHGKVRHWGKGLSVAKWEEKCRYYSDDFGPKYAAKWEARKGKAVHENMRSDFGLPLVLWDDVLNGTAKTEWRRKFKLVS